LDRGVLAGVRAVSFDFGQTLAELDHDFLAQRLQGLGAEFDPSAARGADALAWVAYGAAKAEGHRAAWQAMMLAFLEAGELRPHGGVADPSFTLEIARALWQAQPDTNLWRKPIPGMFELVHELFRAHVPLAIISNSEGKMAELLAELGHAQPFEVVVDSGRLGIDKPDRRIFEYAARALDVNLSELVHVGDAWEADVIGAHDAGAYAIWFAPSDERALPTGVVACRDAGEVRAALSQGFGLALR
jgi:HAD superfamily hydrolase (TIGR01509 family)